MANEKMREEFEAWYLDKFCGGQDRLFRCVNADQIYYFAEVQSKWHAWQASRESLVIELPPMPTAQRSDEEATFSAGGCDMRRKCADLVKAAGLKVKP